MGRPEEPLKRDGSPEREFAFWLRDLRRGAGLTYESLARATNYSTSTMQAAAAGRQLPTLKVTMAFVRACRGDEAAWTKYWTQVKRALDGDSPYGGGLSVKPPWAPGISEPAAAEAEDPGADPTAAETSPVPAEPGPQPTGTAAPPGSAAPWPLPGAPGQAREPTDGDDGWYVERFHAFLRLDTPQPEAVEDRVIVATRQGVRHLATSISVPRRLGDASPVHELNAELLFGGSLNLPEHPYESFFRNTIVLAKPLIAGERHRYRLRLHVPPGQPMAPHYVYMPFQRTDYFELHVRFDPQRLPAKVWTLSGTPPVVLYGDQPDGALVAPDRFGEMRVEFRNLRIGLGYGIRWQE